jgi:hypothetical protein
MNAFFDGYVNAKTTLKHFVGQYENALRDKVEKEKIADFNSFNIQVIPCPCFEQEPFDFSTSSGNINPMITTAVPSGGSSAMTMPPILGRYTSLLFEVQQSSAAMPSSTEMQYDGDGMLDNSMNHS